MNRIFFQNQNQHQDDENALSIARQGILKSNLKYHEEFMKCGFKEGKYDDVVSQMGTGDIILFSGQYEGSRAFKKMQNSTFSHVGIVVLIDGVAYLWESTDIPNISDHNNDMIICNGPMLVNLEERMLNYYGHVCWRRLVFDRPLDFEDKLNEVQKDLKKSFYDMGKLEQLKGIMNLNGYPSIQNSFCSEMVAFTYQAWGLLDDKRSANTYISPDFCSAGGGLNLRRGSPEENKAKLLLGARLESEVYFRAKCLEQSSQQLSSMTEEDFLIFSGVSIRKQKIEQKTDCKLHCVVEAIEGFKLDEFGGKKDGFLESWLPCSKDRYIKLHVGIRAYEPKLPMSYFDIHVPLNKETVSPGLSTAKQLSTWLTIYDKDIFSKSDVLGTIKVPLLLPPSDPGPQEASWYKAETGKIKARFWMV